MSKDDLHGSIEDLRAAVQNLDIRDRKALGRVKRLIADLEHQAANPGDVKHRTSLVESIPRLMEHFEVEHPRVAEILNRVLVALGGMGI